MRRTTRPESLPAPALLLCLGCVLALIPAAADARSARKQPPGGKPEVWPDITQEERNLRRVDQDPDADAVVLLKERNGRILRRADDVVNVIDFHERFKILTERGRRYGDVQLKAGKYSRVSNIRARTVRPDGTALPVEADQIFEKVVFEAGAYKETEWVFHFPAVEPGAILEYRYDRHDDQMIFLIPFYFAGPEFTLRTRLTQAVPGDMSYTVLCDQCPVGQTPTISSWRAGNTFGTMYTQELRNIAGFKDEILMPPERDASPRLEMVLQKWRGSVLWALGRQDRFFIDWASVALYAHSYYDEASKAGQSELKPVVEEWVRGIADPQNRIKTIFRHVQQDFRMPPHRDVYGQTHSIKWMLDGKVADNEDKAVLLMTALKIVGIESDAALVSGKDGGALNPRFYSLSQFTHTIVGIPQPEGGYQWLDPNVAHVPFGFLPWQDSGAEALLIKDPRNKIVTGELITLPTKTELSTSRYRSTVTPRPDGMAVVEVEAEFTGEDAVDLRDKLVPAADSARKEYLEAWVAGIRDGAALRTFVLENLAEVDKPLVLRLGLEVPGLVTNAGEAVFVRGCVMTCTDSNPISRGPRQHPFYVDRGWNREETVLIKAPGAMKVAEGKEAPAFSTRSVIGNLILTCMPQGDEAFECSRVFVVRRNRWPASEQANIRAMFDKIVEADRTTVAFQQSEGDGVGR